MLPASPAYTAGPNHARHSFAAAAGVNASSADPFAAAIDVDAPRPRPSVTSRLGDPFSSGFGRAGYAMNAHPVNSDTAPSRGRNTSRSGGSRQPAVPDRRGEEYDDRNEKSKKFSKHPENMVNFVDSEAFIRFTDLQLATFLQVILVPSSVPVYNRLPFLSQEAELLVQEIADLARQGLIGYPHIYETITGIRITTNFRRAFPLYKPSNFGLVKTIAGRRFDNANAKNIREFTGFNSLSNFCQNHEYNYIVPAGWQNYSDTPPKVRVPQQDWWREYSEFRARIRAEHNAKKEALARERAAAKARESSSGKDKGKGKGKPMNKGNGKGKGKGKAISSDDDFSTDQDSNCDPESNICEACGG